MQVRGKLYELLANCLPPTLILRQLASELLRKVDEDVQYIIVKLAAEYEHRMQVRSPVAAAHSAVAEPWGRMASPVGWICAAEC